MPIDTDFVLQIGTAILMLVLMLAILSPFVSALLDTQASGDTYQVNFDLTGDGKDAVLGQIDTQFGEDLKSITTAQQSLGDAVALTGADDSYVESDRRVTVATDETWTVSTWARVDPSSTAENMTALSVDGRVLIQHNATAANWSAWYFDDGTGDSYRVNVSAPNQPGNLSLVSVTYNGSHLAIYRNTTQGEIQNVSATGGISDAWVNATNWDGTIEESRTWDTVLNDSQRSTQVTIPTRPIDGATPSTRIMYDTRDRSVASVPIYFTSGTLQLSNASFVDGYPGESLTQGSDYEIRNGKFVAVAGGKLDGAPVAWATVETIGAGALIRSVVATGGSALALLVVGVLAIVGLRLSGGFDVGG